MSNEPNDILKAWAGKAAQQQVDDVLVNAQATGIDPISQMNAMIVTSQMIIEMAEKAKAKIEKEQNNGKLH